MDVKAFCLPLLETLSSSSGVYLKLMLSIRRCSHNECNSRKTCSISSPAVAPTKFSIHRIHGMRFNDSSGTNLQKFSNIKPLPWGWRISSLALVNNPAEYETDDPSDHRAAVFASTPYLYAASRSFPDGGHFKLPEITRSGWLRAGETREFRKIETAVFARVAISCASNTPIEFFAFDGRWKTRGKTFNETNDNSLRKSILCCCTQITGGNIFFKQIKK